MKRKMLWMLLAVLLVVCFAVPAWAANGITVEDIKTAFALKYTYDASTRPGVTQNKTDDYGYLWDYGVVAANYTQTSHSEANIFVDLLTKPTDNPILASNSNSTVMATITLPENHTADTMSFALLTEDNEVVALAKDVSVAGQTQVIVRFSQTIKYQYTSEELYVKQVEVDANGAVTSIVAANGKNADGMTVTYGDSVKISTTNSGSYIGNITPYNTYATDGLKLFQTQNGFGETRYTSLTLSKEITIGAYAYEVNSTGNYENKAVVRTSDSSITYKQDKGCYYANSRAWLVEPWQYKLSTTTIGGKTYIICGIKLTQGGNTYIYELHSVYIGVEDKAYYIQETDGTLHKFTVNERTTSTQGPPAGGMVGTNANLATDNILAATKLEQLKTFSVSLAEASYDKDAKIKAFTTTPDASGNSTCTFSSTGDVVSMYNVKTTDTGNGSYGLNLDSIFPAGASGNLQDSGLPLADNEYAVFNIVLPYGASSVNIVAGDVLLRNSDGTTDKAASWKNGEAANYTRVIWNIVTLDENGNIVPFEETVYTGSGHGGTVLAPAGSIVSSTGDAVTLVATNVSAGQEIHHNGSQVVKTTVTMALDATTTTTISGTKTWVGDSNTNSRPQSITVKLQGGGKTYTKTVTADADGNWLYTFAGLPKYEADGTTEITYTISEEKVDFYTTTYNGYNITNTYETVSIAVTKAWVGDSAADRPEYITVNVYDKDQYDPTSPYMYVVKSTSIKADTDGKWSYTFTDLPKYKIKWTENGGTWSSAIVEIEYIVVETNVPAGYTASYSALNDGKITITNTKAGTETTSVSVKKVWNDGNNASRPTSVTVQLYADGTASGEPVTLSETNSWAYTWTSLAKNNSSGTPIAYTVQESAVSGYTASITGDAANGFTITNSLESASTEAKTSVSVKKVWDDGNNQDGLRPESITVYLYKYTLNDDGRKTLTQVGNATIKADANGNWAHTFENLPKQENGTDIVYTVAEYLMDEENYTGSITGDAASGFTITNSHTPETIDISGTKTWDDGGNPNRPSSITVRLLKNGVELKSTTVTAANGWQYTFADLPKCDGGEAITYTITEDAVDGYTTTYSGYNITNKLNTTPSASPSTSPSTAPSTSPSDAPTASPTVTTSEAPTATPTATPTETPTATSTVTTSEVPTAMPTATPTAAPTGTITAVTEVRLQKADRLNPSKKLEGAEYTLFTEETCANVVMLNGTAAVFRTGEDGTAVIRGLPQGTYWVRETKAPEGYEVDPVAYKVVVSPAGETTPVVEVSDYPLRGSLRLSKTVVGDSTNTAFTFEILLTLSTDDPIVGSYDAQLNGTATSVIFTATENGAKATVQLHHGDTLEISGIRAGVQYTITELDSHGYTATASGTVGTISQGAVSTAQFSNSVQQTTFRVQKVWSGLATGETAPDIHLTLYCNGQVYTTATPTADKNGWYTYTGLPAMVNGQAAVYTVKEAPVTGYTTTYKNTGDHASDATCAYNGGTITNCKVPQTGDSTPLTLWAALTLAMGIALCAMPILRRRSH